MCVCVWMRKKEMVEWRRRHMGNCMNLREEGRKSCIFFLGKRGWFLVVVGEAIVQEK